MRTFISNIVMRIRLVTVCTAFRTELGVIKHVI